MYEYLDGIITSVTPTYLSLEVAGVGYLVHVANPYQYEVGDAKQRLYIHQSVSDTNIALYGFATLEDKHLYEQLLNVSGIGAKSGLAIMAGNDNDGLVQAIQTSDVKFLTKFPGIGKKTAQQLILDLKDKLTIESATTEYPLESQPANTNPQLQDALSALQALGFKDKQLEMVQTRLLDLSEVQTTEAYLRAGLKLLTK